MYPTFNWKEYIFKRKNLKKRMRRKSLSEDIRGYMEASVSAINPFSLKIIYMWEN